MAFTSQQNFTANLDGTNAIELNKVMDRSLNNYEDRLECINDTLNNTEFLDKTVISEVFPCNGFSILFTFPPKCIPIA